MTHKVKKDYDRNQMKKELKDDLDDFIEEKGPEFKSLVDDICERNKNRWELLDALKDAMERYPDLRLGQLISNCISPSAVDDLFYVEDIDLKEKLRLTYLKKDWEKK